MEEINLKKETRDFVYEGLEVHPLRKLKGSANDLWAITQRIHVSVKTEVNWNYKRFRKLAKENGATVDLFEVKGITVIPTINGLFEYRSL